MDDLKTLSIKDFKDFGILQEVNRLFFHPIGLALYIIVDEDDPEKVSLGGILDYRGDPEGVYYGEGFITEKNKLYTKRLREMKREARVAIFGHHIQKK